MKDSDGSGFGGEGAQPAFADDGIVEDTEGAGDDRGEKSQARAAGEVADTGEEGGVGEAD